uniref:Uncharacterized protein n=1 Tax=Cyprinus carpio TaxID=7962 RepID=A0A8C1X0E8_CYPCA
MSGGLTDLLKTGFSMFMKVTRPHPSDHPLLFLFLVGGVTPSELRLIREVVSTHKSGTQVGHHTPFLTNSLSITLSLKNIELPYRVFAVEALFFVFFLLVLFSILV